MADIVDRINAACNGHWFTRTKWTSGLLNDAVEEITSLREHLEELQKENDGLTSQVDELELTLSGGKG